MESLGSQLRAARLASGLTLRDLAAKVDRAASYINDIEHDRRVPSEEVTRDLARVLELDADRLLASGGRMPAETLAWLQASPSAGVLFRKVSGGKLSDPELDRIIKYADRVIGGREES